MHLPVKKGYKHGFGAPRKFLSSVASWLIVAPLVSVLGVGIGVSSASAASYNISSHSDFYVTFSTTQILTISTSGSTDPMLWIFNASQSTSATSCSGDLYTCGAVARNDDYNGLNSYISVSLAAGSYRVHAGLCCSYTESGSFGGTSYTLNSSVDLSSVGASVPGAPTIGTATATSATSANVSFSAPASNGGSTITSYRATSSPGGITGTLSQAGSGTITVNGLSPDTSYTFTVTATNAAGTSPVSSASNSTKTATVAPTINSTTIGYQSITVNASLTSGVRNTWFYQIEVASGTGCADPDGVGATSSTSASSGTFTISGITNGCTYTLNLANWNGVTSAFTSTSITTCALGLCSTQPGKNAQEIKSTINTNTNGVYWITVNGVATQVYCIMDSAMDGGGWMLAMKGANTGNTFNYSSNYWTTTNTLNTSLTRRNDTNNEDAKFNVFNYTPAQKVMAIFPDATAGGAITGQSYGFVWNESMPTPANTTDYTGRPTQGNYFAKSLRELFAGGEKIFIRDATSSTPYNPTRTAGGTQIFSTQSDVRFFGFNYLNNNGGNGWNKARFGFGWNENGGGLYPNGNEQSNDVSGGIGIDRADWSAGDVIACCQNATGLNRQMKFELYVKAVDSVPATLTYNGNTQTSGSVPTDGTSYVVGQSATVLGNTGTLAKAGYTFAGWADNSAGTGTVYTSGNSYALPVASSILYAKWTANVYTVTYNYNGATGGNGTASANFTTGGTAITLPSPTRTGYTFGGWYSDAGLTTSIGAAGAAYSPTGTTTSLTSYAKWTANAYTVTYNYNGATGGNGTVSANFTTGGTTITLPTPTRTGYTFGGWYSDAGLTSSIGAAGAAYSPTGATTSLTAYGKWTANTYSVTIDPQGGGAVSTGLIGYWTFDDASALGKNSVDGTSLSSTGATFTASGKNGGGLALNGGQYLSGTVANLPVGSSQYTIGGWMKTTSAGSQGILGWGTWGSGSRTNALRTNGNSGFYNYWWGNDLLGNYSIATNTWIYVIATYDGTTQRIYVNGTQIVSRVVSAPSVDNVNFRIGTTNNGEWFYGTLDDIVIYNRGLSASEISSLYSSAPTISSWIYGNTLTLPVAPTRSGYTFNGWYDAASGGTRLGDASAVITPTNTADFTIYAQWTANSFTVTYNYNNATGGNDTSSATYSTGSSALVLPTPTRTGYSFGGWYSDAGLTTSIGAAGANYTPTVSLTAYAKWNGISNTVNFDAQGGAAVSSLLWTTGTSLTLPAAPTRAGYTFNGWYDSATGGTRVGSASASYTPTNTASFTLYAQWSANSNTVAFNAQGGSAVASQSWTTATSLTLPSAPTRAGYTFNGWYDAASGGTRLGSGTVTRNGLDFDGIDDAVTVPHSNSFNFTNAVTVEAWFKTTKTSEQYITTKNDDSFYVGINLSAGKVSFYLNGVSSGSGGWLHSAATVTDGQWHHFAGTYDGATIKVYVDGVLSASRNVSSTILAGSSPINIGARGGGSRFQGSMYDVRYWNVVRSASEISATMNSALTGSETGLIANYSFNQGTAGGSNAGVTTATSTTGTNSGTLSGFALTGTTSNWIEASAGSSSYSPTNTSGFTIYAQWGANTNVVTFDTLGGSAVTASSFQTGGSLTLPAAPTLAGSTFVGWFLAPSGGTALTTPYSPVATGALTIYARWNTNRTLSINSGSYLAGYARSGTPPTLTATPTAGVGTGTITFASATTSVCTINATSGLVAFVNTGTCTITAAITEAGGFTSATSPAISFSVRATPGVPTSLAATPGNGQVTISWSAPTDTGGGISSYLVTASPGGATCSWSSGPLSCAVTGLTNGTSYSFTVASVNSQGSSATSLAVLATPRTVPGAPSITNVTPLVQDSWKLVYQTTSPTRSGGAIVYTNGYGKGVSDQAAQLSSLGTSFNRIRYRMEVNYNGVLRYADVSFDKWNGATIATLAIPDLVDTRVVKVNVTNLNIDSNWPGFAGVAGAVTTGTGKSGRLELWPWDYGTGTTGITPAGNPSIYDNDDTPTGSSAYGSFQVHNLTDNQTVLAWNNHSSGNPDIGFGNSLSSHPDWTFYGKPNFDGATWKLQIFIDSDPNSASVAFTAPSSNGGSVITGYTVTASNGSTATGTASPITVTGLSLGVPYTFTVTATNAAGTSVASAPSTSITLRSSPSAPIAPTPSLTVGGVALVWPAPSANGGTVSDYTIQYSSNGGSTWTTYVDEVSPTTASTVRGLTTGTSYLFRVAAISEQGSGAFSPASAAITPAAAPDTPAKPTGYANGTSITITWAAPNANGATISSYNVSYSSDSGNTWTSVAPASTTSATVANLTIALTYIFRVQAVNARGISGFSVNSDPIAIGTAPLPPTILVAAIDATAPTSAILSWKKPSGGAGIVEAKTTVDTTTFTAGLLGKRYVGYYDDNMNFFNTAPLFAGTGTPVNSTSIFNFSSNADYYSWMWTGYFKASVSGVYRFYLSSDDASHLWIGDTATTGYTAANAVVNNGGLHPTVTRTGSIQLIAGQSYPIRLMFGENGGGDIVSLFWDLPNGTRITNGTGYFFQNPNGSVASAVKGCAATVGNSGGVLISKEGNNCVVKFTNPGVNTWTVPDGITSADVLVVGGGGGAGFDAAGGGGGGAVVERFAQSVTPGSTFNVNVGVGGATSQSVGGQAQDGGTSVFGTISAVGGGGGGSKNASGRGVVGAGGGGGGHANPGNNGVTLGGTPSSGADSFWGWSASNPSMVNNQGSVAQFSYIQASLTRTIPLNLNVTSNVTFSVSVDNSINNIIGWIGERIDTYSIKAELLNSSGAILGQQTFNGTTKHALELRQVTVPYSGTVANLRLTITGFDAGYWAGFYGPIFRNPSLTVNGALYPPTNTVSGFGGGGASGSRAVGNGGGGGGAGGVGGGSATSAGGPGVLSSLTGTYFGGGGAGGSWNSTGGIGGIGGGGNGGNGSGAICGNDGAPNTGGGGGAMGNAVCSNRTLGAGGSGVVILRYAAANANVELPPPSDYIIQYAEAADTSPLVSTGLVLQYEANSYSGSGTTLVDSRGNSNGTIANAPTFTSANGGYFNMVGGSSNYIITNTSLNSQFTSQANSATTSVFMWVYPTAANGILISEFGGPTIGSGWHDSQIEMVNGTMRFRVWNGANLGSAIATPLNNWYYVGFVYDQSARTLKAYINGQLAVTGTSYFRETPYTNGGANLHFGIGATDSTNLGSGAYGSFRFGSLHVYNVALTQAQIQQNYAAGCARFSLCDGALTWQTFDDGVSPLESATVTDLVPGKNYIFRVASKNGVGPSSYTAASNAIAVRGAPGATPTIGTVTAGDQSAVVTFTAPTNTGGSPITRYTATAVASGTPALPNRTCQWSTGALTCTIGQLTNGREYTVTVTASNSFGTSLASAGVTVTPKRAPGAPTALTAVGSSTQLALTWSAPLIDGGSAITGYRIERSTLAAPTWVVAVANTGSATTSATLTGLTNGTLYNIRITAINIVGAGTASDVATGTPKSAPSAPSAPTGNASNASAFITWSAPVNNGAPITDYEIAFATNSAGPWTTFTDDVTSATAGTVTGLTNGTAYYFRVRAINSVGAGEWSPASTAKTPATTPGAPTLTGVAPIINQPGKLALTFTSGNTGGSIITGYEFSINGGATWSVLTGTSNLSISGLTNGVTYAVQIRAVNAQGVGPASSAVSGAPTAPADAPVITGAVPSDGTLTISFSAPANNGGSEITGYKYQIRGSSGIWSSAIDVAASPLVITGLSNGALYSVQLLSVNSGGDGAWSTTAQGTPFTTPSAPSITSITPGNGTLAIAYTVTSNGSAITATEFSLDGGATWTRSASMASPLTVTGLVNGSSYTPTIRAVNAAGAGASAAGSATTPYTTPFAPAINSVTSTSTSITMNFTINSGGSAVTNVGYRTRSVSAAGITSCAASYATLSWSNNWSDWSEVAATNSISLNGLSSSNCYDVQIRGKNLAGYGGSSRESGKPVSVPSAPEIVSVTAGAASLGVTFSESADNGGAAITAYEYRIGSGSWTSLATIPGFTLGTSTFFTIPSLTNGTSYSITLRAVNSAGASSASTALTGTPVTTPAAPTISSVDPLDGALRVTFAAPTSTGGSAILGYQYSLNNGTWVLLPSSAAITSFTIPGLSNGTPYQVSLRAINARGNGSANSFSENVAPGTVPEAPTISAIIVADQQVSLVVAPGLDGGWPLTRYEYSINSGTWVPLVGAPSVALANPIVITNLVNGTTYSFRVRAVNYIGESSASADANGTPATLPSAPAIVSTSSSDGSLSIAFTAPTSNGGSTVSTYEYSVNGGTTWTRRASGGNTSPLVISGLTNGVAYNVKIRSVNGIGAGAESSAQTAIPQIPGAGRPISVTTTPLDSSVRISWAPPAAYVGAPIVGYRVNATPGTSSCTWTTGEYNCVISGLTNGTSYTFTVTSLRDDNGTTRDIDTSAASATTAPRTLPSAPTSITAVGGGNEATLSWSAPANTGGAAITDYLTEYSSDSGATWSTYSDAITAETTATVGGLTPGVTYRFRVSAINAAGVGASSTSSNAAKTFEQAPELTTTLDQQTADGFSFILSFPDPISFTIAATTNNPNAVVEQVGDYFTVRGLAPGASVTVTVTANRADYLQAITTIFSSALLAAPAPTVSAATSLDGAFRVTVDGYTTNTTAGTSYAVTTTAGAVIDDGAGVYRIVGLANGESAIATVTSSRPGYVTKATSVSGSALYLGVPAQISDITGTRDGFTFILANYAPEATYQITSSNSSAVISRTAELVTITGLTNLEVASVTVKTLRTGYMDASADVIGVALPQSEVNTLSAISLSTGAIAFDPATYEYSLNVSNTVSTYRVTPTKSDIDSTIAISINGGAFTSITSGAQSSSLSLNVGINTITIAVTSQVGSIQNYILYVNRAKSTVSTLGSISFSSGTITGFDAGLTTYDLTVPYGSSSITATLAPTNSAATMRIKANSGSFASVSSGVASSALSLNVGNNLVVVEITAEDGLATSLYEFTVTRSGAANSQLGSLAISVGTMATFAPGTLNYEVIVPNGTTSASVTPTLGSGVTGSITVNGVDLADGATSAPISLTGGTTNQITIVVTASDGSSTPYVINVKVDAPPVALALTRESVGTQSNVAFTTQPQISINDAQNNRVLLNTSTVTVAITSGAGGQLIGATTATAVRGLATFATLGLRGIAGTTYTLTYSSGDLTIATQQITLTPGEASALAFRAGSSTVASGALFTTPLQVAAVDSDGNTVSTFGSAITVTVSGNGALSGATIRTPASGIATFTDLSLRGTAANSYTITASSSGLTNATRTVALTFGAPSALAITRASAGPVSGSVFTTQPEITIRDSAGNAVTSATGEVTASIASGVGGTLGGTTTVTLVNGVATFTDLVLSGSAGTAYTIAYSTSGVTSVSEILTLSAGAAARVQLATPAAGFNNGTAFTRTQPVLRIQDSTGNTVATSNAIVTATVSSGGVLLGTTAQSASSGIVTFTNLGVFGTPGSTYTITFASPGLLSTTQTVLLTSGSSLTPTFGSTTPTIDGFTVQITNFNRIFNWTFSLLEGNPATQISLGGNGLLTVTGMPVGGSAIISATTSRNGFENGAATITGSTLLAPLNPTFSATTSTATGFRAQVTNFDSSFTWRISASNGGTAMISSTGLVTVIDLNPGVSSDVTVTTSKSGRVSASATVTGSATGLDTTTGTRDLAANLLTDATLYPICAGGTSANEGIGNLNDRNSKTKYLCFNASSRLNASYIRNSAGFYTGNIGSKLVTGIQFTSGDSDRSRDPIIYSLFGCTSLNGGCSPIVVNGRTAIDVLRNDTASVQSFLNTTPYNYYKVTFGALRTSWTDALQVAEVALIGTDANGAGLTPTFGAVTPAANGFTVQITNFNSAYTWRGSVNNNGGVSIGADGLVTVTGLAGATTGTVAITSSRPKFESATASISGTSLNSAFIPTFGAATPTADGFVVTIANFSSDYTWSASVTTGAATISGGVLTVTGQSAADQAVVTVITNRNGYATGRAQVVATALADGLTPNFGPSLGTSDGFTIQIRNYSNLYTWNLSASSGQAAINATGLITVTGLAAGASSTVTVSTSKTGSFTVITQAAGKAPIGTGLTPRFTLSTSTGDGFTAQILNYDAAYTWSGAVNAGSVTISGTGLVTVTGVSTGIMATATISTARAGYVSASNTIAGTAIAPRTQTIVGEDIKLEVPISAATSSTDVTVVVDIPVDAAPSSTSFTGRAVATDTVDQGLRTIRLDGSSGGSTVTTVSAPIAITIPASAGIGVPVYSPDGANWVELPLLAAAALPEGQEMGYYKYDDGTILILTRKIGG